MLFLQQKEKELVCRCLELFNTRMFLTAKVTKTALAIQNATKNIFMTLITNSSMF